MKRQLLVTLDDSLHSRSCLNYLSVISEVVRDLYLTLYHVQPTISGYLLEEAKKDLEAMRTLEKIAEKNREKAISLLSHCKDSLMHMGINGDRIQIVTAPKTLGLAKDILEKGLKERYDAIVAGRRGLSGLQQFFMGSLTAKLVEYSAIPVWVIDGEKFNSKIMAAVDGSESALKAVDHALFMIHSHPGAKLTLYHVKPMLKDYCEIDFTKTGETPDNVLEMGDRRCLADFYGHVRRKIKEYQMGEHRIEYVEVDGKLSVGKTILSAAQHQGFGNLVIGRRGIDRSFYTGSVSNYVIKNGGDMAIWVVP
ncbi:MAG: universal stress protein [Pseudomonadota bacterium]